MTSPTLDPRRLSVLGGAPDDSWGISYSVEADKSLQTQRERVQRELVATRGGAYRGGEAREIQRRAIARLTEEMAQIDAKIQDAAASRVIQAERDEADKVLRRRCVAYLKEQGR